MTLEIGAKYSRRYFICLVALILKMGLGAAYSEQLIDNGNNVENAFSEILNL